jgi:Transposase DDE domain
MRELDLIRLYYYLCECYDTELRWHCQKFSNNSSPSNEKITDSELLTIYFYCRLYENKHKKAEIYDYTIRYMSSWFPKLPNYSNFNARINALNPALLALLPILLQNIENQGIVKGISQDIVLVDSYPIILCSGKRQGKVATELSDKSFCSTKNLYYYGVKMHMVARKVEKTIPLMDFVSITPASENDLTALRPILPKLEGKAIFADKAYADVPLNQELLTQQDTYIYTPVKLIKGQTQTERQFKKAADSLFSTAVSTVRQPVESLFNWINEKTELQNASKVRALNALMTHIFGALATALFHYIF